MQKLLVVLTLLVDMIIFIFIAGGWVYDDPRRVYSPRKYFAVKKLLAVHNISDVQRDVIGRMLAEEEAKLLDLFSPLGHRGLVSIE